MHPYELFNESISIYEDLYENLYDISMSALYEVYQWVLYVYIRELSYEIIYEDIYK